MIRKYFTYLDHIIFDSIECFLITHHFLFFSRFPRLGSRSTFLSHLSPLLRFLASRSSYFSRWCLLRITVSSSLLRISLSDYTLLRLLLLLLFTLTASPLTLRWLLPSLELFLLFLSHFLSPSLRLNLSDSLFFLTWVLILNTIRDVSVLQFVRLWTCFAGLDSQ